MSENQEIEELFENNRKWAEEVRCKDSEFFMRTASEQTPKYLWIGCSDSRVSPNQITGLGPGELFVHRNVANVVEQADRNCLAVVEFAVRVLEVRHIIVCGHYGCGGVRAAMDDAFEGTLGKWLGGIGLLWEANKDRLLVGDQSTAHAQMAELNVRTQMLSLCRIPLVEQVWESGKFLRVHGWIYGLEDGLIHRLYPGIGSLSQRAQIESESGDF